MDRINLYDRVITPEEVQLIADGCSSGVLEVKTLTILGGNGTPGDIDPYTEASRDGGGTWGPVYLFNENTLLHVPTYSGERGAHPWGELPGTNAWINFDPSPFVGLNSTTDYRIQFNVPADFTNPTMIFSIKADNKATIKINGATIAIVEGQKDNVDVADAVLDTSLVPGLNNIYIKLEDTGGWVGLNYVIVITGESCGPLTLEPSPYFIDADGDGVGVPKDCDDTNPNKYPGATELCDGIDNDCNGTVDDVLNTYWVDGDSDGYGDPEFPEDLIACSTPIGYSDNSDDCDDADNDVYPGAPEQCDGKDNDCDGEVDEGLDLDEDGVCNDEDNCPGTANGAIVNSSGCSIEQQCSIDGDWKNHGKYVSCVSHATEELVAEGKISEEEKDAIVSSAAGSSVGKNNKGKGKNK